MYRPWDTPAQGSSIAVSLVPMAQDTSVARFWESRVTWVGGKTDTPGRLERLSTPVGRDLHLGILLGKPMLTPGPSSVDTHVSGKEQTSESFRK